MFRLQDRPVSALMAPRGATAWLDLNDSPEDLRRKIAGRRDSSDFVICQGGLDNVLGVVPVEALLARCLAGQPISLRAALQQPVFVPEGQSALTLPALFKQAATRLALVIDEYGRVQGVVTITAVLKALAADIRWVPPQAIRRQDGAWLVDGLLPVDEFKRIFYVRTVPEAQRGNYRTVGGFVMTVMRRIPCAGDYFEWKGLRFEVIDMDGHRVSKVLVKRLEPCAKA